MQPYLVKIFKILGRKDYYKQWNYKNLNLGIGFLKFKGYQYVSLKTQGTWRRANSIMSLKQIIKLILVDAMAVLTCEATCLHLKMSTSKAKHYLVLTMLQAVRRKPNEKPHPNELIITGEVMGRVF